MFATARNVCRPVATLRTLRMSTQRINTPRFSRGLVTQKYSQDHESVKFDDETNVGTVTITHYAQTSLGDVVFVELPEEGTTVAKGDAVGAVESVKAASEIYSPVSGKVVAINETLGAQPALLNKSPENEGWLFKIEVTDPSELDELMTLEQYKEHCES